MPISLIESSFFQNIKNDRYRLKLIVLELEKATAPEYQSALLAFINCIIISAPSLQDRLRIRNEFIGEIMKNHDESCPPQCCVFFSKNAFHPFNSRIKFYFE